VNPESIQPLFGAKRTFVDFKSLCNNPHECKSLTPFATLIIIAMLVSYGKKHLKIRISIHQIHVGQMEVNEILQITDHSFHNYSPFGFYNREPPYFVSWVGLWIQLLQRRYGSFQLGPIASSRFKHFDNHRKRLQILAPWLPLSPKTISFAPLCNPLSNLSSDESIKESPPGALSDPLATSVENAVQKSSGLENNSLVYLFCSGSQELHPN
jgi:hypothetical protein